MNEEHKKNAVYKELNNSIDNFKQDVSFFLIVFHLFSYIIRWLIYFFFQIPRFIRRLENYSIDKEIKINKKLKLKDFKYAFKYVSAKTVSDSCFESIFISVS